MLSPVYIHAIFILSAILFIKDLMKMIIEDRTHLILLPHHQSLLKIMDFFWPLFFLIIKVYRCYSKSIGYVSIIIEMVIILEAGFASSALGKLLVLTCVLLFLLGC